VVLQWCGSGVAIDKKLKGVHGPLIELFTCEVKAPGSNPARATLFLLFKSHSRHFFIFSLE
jgi:hypothetical protein